MWYCRRVVCLILFSFIKILSRGGFGFFRLLDFCLVVFFNLVLMSFIIIVEFWIVFFCMFEFGIWLECSFLFDDVVLIFNVGNLVLEFRLGSKILFVFLFIFILIFLIKILFMFLILFFEIFFIVFCEVLRLFFIDVVVFFIGLVDFLK